MQEKLDMILEKLELISGKIDELDLRIAQLEDDAAAERNDILCEVQAISQFVTTLTEFQELDFCRITTENTIFLHTDALRTASFISALVEACNSLVQTNQMTKEHLTPEYLQDIMQKNRHIVVNSEIFSWSEEFEVIVKAAITADTNNFYILTGDPESIPQSIRNKMRTMQ